MPSEERHVSLVVGAWQSDLSGVSPSQRLVSVRQLLKQ